MRWFLLLMVLGGCAMHNRIQACNDAGFTPGSHEFAECLQSFAIHGELIGR